MFLQDVWYHQVIGESDFSTNAVKLAKEIPHIHHIRITTGQFVEHEINKVYYLHGVLRKKPFVINESY